MTEQPKKGQKNSKVKKAEKFEVNSLLTFDAWAPVKVVYMTTMSIQCSMINLNR